MSFEDMPDRGQLTEPGAQDFVDQAIELSKQTVAATRNVLDVAYGDDYYQKIDIFLPTDESLTDLPILMFIHGGAWRHGFKEWMGFIAPPIINLPAIFVTVNHRLTPEHKFPTHLDDCCDALAWVHRNIEQHGGNPNRIFVGGHSSGGHLAALLALRKDCAAARSLPVDVVKGCFPVSGAHNLHLDDVEPGSRRATILGEFLAQPGDDRDASPIDHVGGNQVPFFIAWGSKDVPAIAADSERLATLLRDQPGAVEYHVFEGCTHFQTNEACGDPDNLWVVKVREWMAGSS